MSTISYTVGDATDPVGDGAKVIVHICNDVGGWGRGFVLALSGRWSEPEASYRAWFAQREGNDFGLGAVQFVQVEEALWVANVVGQRGVKRSKDGPPVRYDAVRKGMGAVAAFAKERGASVHMPRIGCGLAGGRWEEIEPILQDTLVVNQVVTIVYDFAPK